MWKMDKETIRVLNKCMMETDPRNGWYGVTPELAKLLLEYNVNNYRVFNKNVLEKYAKDMKNGLWQKNGEPIVFSKEGILNNGQHRLKSIIKSGVAVIIYLIFDADKSDIYDSQYKRTITQILRSVGYSVTTAVPATARVMMAGKFSKMNVGEGQIIEYCIDHMDHLKLAENIVCTNGLMCRKAACETIVYCILKTGEMTEREMRDFFKVVNSGKKCRLRREVGSALAINKYFKSNPYGSYDERNRMLEYVYKAMLDFHSNVYHDPKEPYTSDTNLADRLIKMVQCMDGHCPIAA